MKNKNNNNNNTPVFKKINQDGHTVRSFITETVLNKYCIGAESHSFFFKHDLI